MSKAIRDAYGEALVKYGKDDNRVVVLDADVSSSTKSCIFASAVPERFYNFGIAEANMCAAAGGMAAFGKIPFVNTFAVFMTSIGLMAARSFGSYARLPVKYIGAYGGLSDSFDGPSHHSLEDIAVMRTLPGFKVYVASDAVQTDWLIKNAIEDLSPMYIRMSRNAFSDIYQSGESFETGRGKIVREGADVSIIACGLMVGHALTAAEMLSKEGVECRVVDMFCIKPIDRELILDCAEKSKIIITAEEHNVIGGLASVVSEVLCGAGATVKTGFVGLMDTHAECGPYDELQQKYEIDPRAICAKVRSVLSR